MLRSLNTLLMNRQTNFIQLAILAIAIAGFSNTTIARTAMPSQADLGETSWQSSQSGFLSIGWVDLDDTSYIAQLKENCTTTKEASEMCSTGRLPSIKLLSQDLEEGGIWNEVAKDDQGQRLFEITVTNGAASQDSYSVMALLKPTTDDSGRLPRGVQEANCDFIHCQQH